MNTHLSLLLHLHHDYEVITNHTSQSSAITHYSLCLLPLKLLQHIILFLKKIYNLSFTSNQVPHPAICNGESRMTEITSYCTEAVERLQECTHTH